MTIVPAYVRPGASGGALFAGENLDLFYGLITKVSSSGEPLTLAIPSNVIQEVLEFGPLGQWIRKNNAMVMEYKNGKITIDIGESTNQYISAGGELSNGGGELSNGGGELSNGGAHKTSPYWQLDVKDSAFRVNRSTKLHELVWYYRQRTVEIISPFLRSSSSPVIDGKEVSFLGIQMPPPKSGFALMDANLGVFNYYMERAKNITQFFKSPENNKLLNTVRKQVPAPILKFARLYRFDTPNHLTLVNDNCDTNGGSQAQALAPSFDRVVVDGLDAYGQSVILYPAACFRKKPETTFDREHFSLGTPFRVRANDQLAADVKFHDENGQEIELTISQYLDSIVMTGPNVNLHLTPDLRTGPANQFYQESSGAKLVDAVAIYNTEGLTNLSRLLIRTPKQMIEFLTCTPGLDCGG